MTLGSFLSSKTSLFDTRVVTGHSLFLNTSVTHELNAAWRVTRLTARRRHHLCSDEVQRNTRDRDFNKQPLPGIGH